MNLTNETDVRSLIELAKREDLGEGDLSTDLLADPREVAEFRLLAKAPCVFAGARVAPMVLAAYDESIALQWIGDTADGRRIEMSSGERSAASELATLAGPLGTILSAERVLLNLLQRLCGVATLTRRFVDAIEGTAAKIYDTRKTTPGWRALEKYAVRCGGGENHRMGLYDGVLIKDNHLAFVPTPQLAGYVFDLLNRLVDVGDSPPFVEVESDTTEQVEELLKVVGIDAVLLDNFSTEDLRRAVAMRDEAGLKGTVALEASGSITLDTVRGVAETGVERISVGAVTHSAVSVDLSLERV